MDITNCTPFGIRNDHIFYLSCRVTENIEIKNKMSDLTTPFLHKKYQKLATQSVILLQVIYF